MLESNHLIFNAMPKDYFNILLDVYTIKKLINHCTTLSINHDAVVQVHMHVIIDTT